MRARRILLVATVTAGVLAGSLVATPAFADSGTDSATIYGAKLTTSQVAEATAVEAKVAKFRTAIIAVDGRVTFDAARALALGADGATVQQVATGVTAAGGTVTGIKVDQAAVARTAAIVTASKARCVGKTNYSVQWFGDQLKLNTCDVSRIIAALSIGAGAAGITAIVLSETGVGGIAAGVIAGLLAIGAGALQWCSSDGTGVIFDVSWAGVPWCAAQ